MTATRAQPETQPLPEVGRDTTLRLIVHENTVTVHGLRIAHKWTSLAIAILADGPLGYAEMRRSTPGISDKMLAQTLRRLERDGLVSRAVNTAKPIRVTYALTALGETLVPPLGALHRWAAENGPILMGNQNAYDQQFVQPGEPEFGQA